MLAVSKIREAAAAQQATYIDGELSIDACYQQFSDYLLLHGIVRQSACLFTRDADLSAPTEQDKLHHINILPAEDRNRFALALATCDRCERRHTPPPHRESVETLDMRRRLVRLQLHNRCT